MIISSYLGVAGLSDIGYRFYTSAEAPVATRITTGIVDAGDGWYSVDATIPATGNSVRWDSTGTAEAKAREYLDLFNDPWTKAVPNGYAAGTAGKILGDNLDAKISTRSTYAGGDTAGTTTLLSRIASALTITGGKVDVNDKTGFALTSAYDAAKTAAAPGAAMTLTAAYDAAKTAAQAGTAMTLTSGERTTLSGVIWGTLTSTLATANSIGKWIVDSLPGIVPGAVGGLLKAGSNAPVTMNISGNLIGDVTGNIQGSVNNVVNAPTEATIAVAVRDVSNASPAVGSLGADVKTGAVGGDPWATPIPGAYAAGTAGNILGSRIDAAVSSRLATSGYTPPIPAADIAVATRDVNNTSPAANSLGAAVNAAASAGDPWGTQIPASYGAGTAGKILGERLDALVSTRLATTAYTVPPTSDIIAQSVRDVNNQTPAANSLGAAVNAAASAGDPWGTQLPGSYPAGSAGKLVSDQLDAKVSSRLSSVEYTVPPTVAAISVGVRDVDNTSPAPGSLGDKVNSAASAGDPWSTALPGAYAAGTAGSMIGNNVDAKISTRLADSAYSAPPSANVIAQSVRDIDNTAPATNSLGAMVKTGAGTGDPWAVALPNGYADGSAGKILGDNLDAKVSTRSTYAGGDTAGTTTLLSRIASALNITGGKVDVNDKTGFALTAAYDAAKTAAAPGEAMTLTGSEKQSVAATVWQTLTSMITTAGSIGKLIVDNLNASISSRLPSSSYIAPDNATIIQINSKTANLPANPASVTDIPTSAQNAAATRDVSNATPAAGSLGADVKAGSLATDPWSSNLPGSYPAGTAGSIIGSRLDASVSSRLATNAITLNGGAVTVGTNNDKTGYSLAAGQDNLIVDAILKRDWQAISGEATYSILQALRFLRCRWQVKPDGTLEVFKEDGITVAWSRNVQADPTAEPIVAIS